MEELAVEEARERLARWIEDGQSVLRLFEEHQRLRVAAEAAERECARLRDELVALRAETNFLIDERGEIAELIAEGLNKVMNDALQRLRTPLDAPRFHTTTDASMESRASLTPEPTYS